MESEKLVSAVITMLVIAVVFRIYLNYISKKRVNIQDPRESKKKEDKKDRD